jgi:putative restriction endonuclease
MKIYAGVTNQDWFDYLRAQPGIDEVNFWQPSPNAEFRALMTRPAEGQRRSALR